MNRRVAQRGLLTLLMLAAAPVSAQYQTPDCLPNLDRGNAVELSVDALGGASIIHIDRIGGSLLRTHWDIGEAPVDETLANNVSRLGFVEIDDTGVTANAAGELRLCYFDATLGQLRVALEAPDGWHFESVLGGMRVGDQCDLREAPNGTLYVAFHHDNRLEVATRTAVNTWNVVVANETLNKNVGVDPGLGLAADGSLVIAHANVTDGPLRVTTKRLNGNYATVEIDTAPFAAGASPRVAFDARGELYIVHGLRPARLDVDGDANLVVTQGAVGGPYRTTFVEGDFIGGSNGAASTSAGRLYVATRERSRGGLFPRSDGLRLFEGLPGNSQFVDVETWGAGVAEHQYRNIALAIGPLGFPQVAYAVEVSASIVGPGGGYTCLVRPLDTDGDRLPDAGEATLRTNPRLADTDGDGVSDGLEVLRDHTDPLVRGDGPPPDPDAAVVDPPEPDAAVIFPPDPDAFVPPPAPDAFVPPPPADAFVPPPPADAFVPPPPDARTLADARSPDASGEGGAGGGMPVGGNGGEPGMGGNGGQPTPGGEAATGGDPGTGGIAANGGEPGSGGAGGALADAGGPEADASAGGGSGKAGGSGCAVTPGNAPASAPALLLFALPALYLRRRRAHRS